VSGGALHASTAGATAGRTLTQNAIVGWSGQLNNIHTATQDTTRLSRLPVDRRRRNAGQAGSYAYSRPTAHTQRRCTPRKM